MLTINNIEVVYDNVVLVLKGISIEVKPQSITTILGANGAGKTTTLKSISGLLKPERGAVTRGSIEFNGERIDRLPPHEVVSKGIVQVFEGRRIFTHLSVEDNLLAGAHTVPDYSKVKEKIEQAYTFFPRLKERRTSEAGYLSGGEQQMLAIGRALMSDPKVIMLDEPSLGLAPLIIEEIFGIIQRMREEAGVTVLLVEQNANLALSIADHGYVMENGSIVMEGPAKQLASNSEVQEFYLGIGESGEKRSYRDVKRYRRRKRWLS
ncbi:MAG: ABC transporter ATP-binding protein [Rhizobiales bacterium NRL2]|jgi:branched-chain amino acid transport system ATP-binding protein|nr:MAG: ABC transporter ATP-binding protein [Rhizobiales bacterium NRL2]